MFRNPTIGADPELFVFDTKTQKYVTAEGLIPGSKRDTYPVYDVNGKMYHGHMQVDGVAAEFNTQVFPIGKRSAEFVGNVVTIHKLIEQQARKKNKNVELRAIPTADFDETYFKGLSEQSRELGCDPDYNGYDGYANVRPDNNVCYRTGSGHVHVGWCPTTEQNKKGIYEWDPGDNDHYEKCMALAVELDFYLGLPSLLWDADARRRSLYGRAGAFRPKTYGMEYRVLSNVWVGNEKLIGYVYDQTRSCVERFDTVRLVDKYGMAAAEAINASDVETAKSLMTDIGLTFPEV